MAPKRKPAAAAAAPAATKAPATPVKTPPASPSKAAQSPAATPKSHEKRSQQRSRSVTEAAPTPRASQTPRTPERQGSRNDASSPLMPPAPATTPVPASDRTPKRGSERSATLSLSASPVPLPVPPTTPVPASKRTSASQGSPSQQQQKQQKQQPSASPSSRVESPAKKTQSAATPQKAKSEKALADTPATVVSPPPAAAANATAVAGGETAVASSGKKPLSRNVKRQRSRHARNGAHAVASPADTASPLSKSVEHVIQESKVIAPDVSGVRCIAVHPSEQQVVVARENGSLVLYDVSFFQNIPQFVQRRHTGGQTKRTVTSLAYVALPEATATSTTAMAAAAAAASSSAATTAPSTAAVRYVLVASMMSGQIVVYDADLLVPIALHQRSGGAIWQLAAVHHACLYGAMADGSWQQLRLASRQPGQAPQLELVRVVPGISGADRALTVSTSTSLRMAVGSDDAGNVHAWRLPVGAAAEASEDATATGAGAARGRGLAEHETLWTTKLAKGIALSCAIVGGTRRPCVVVGTSMGDVVLLDAAHGHVFQTFSQHKGPVTTLVVHADAVVYASGWHESLRSYRCSNDGDWYPAEVKRRTHYHEASQLALMPQRQLMLSASRDGTVMYAPLAQLFTKPAMYVPVTTQQFAYAAGRAVLLQSRFDTVEAFCMDGAGRHWVPFFAHRLDGRFHLSGLWCDESLEYIVFSTEERVGLLRVVWRGQSAMSISRLEEVLELPARSGVVDVCWSSSGSSGSLPSAAATGQPSDGARAGAEGGDDADGDDKTEEEEGGEDSGAAAAASTSSSSRVLHLLYDETVTSVTLAAGYPAVHTSIAVRGKALPGDSLRPYTLVCRPTSPCASAASGKARSTTSRAAESAAAAAHELVVYGHQGSCRLQLTPDGTPAADTLITDVDDVYELVQAVPELRAPPKSPLQAAEKGGEPRSKKAKTEASSALPAVAASLADAAPPVLVGLSATQQRYVVGATLHSAAAGTAALPATLPHDVRWIARIAPSHGSAPASAKPHRYLGYFSRGLLVACGDAWHMVRRMNVEAAFVVKGGSAVLVLERNLEKTLEALPLSWKVRRFGN